MRFSEFSKFKIRPHLFENKQQYKQIMDTMVSAGLIDQSTANSVLGQVKQLLKRADRIIWWLRWWRISTTYEVLLRKIQQEDPDMKNTEKLEEYKRLFKKLTKKDFDTVEVIKLQNFERFFSLAELSNHWAAMFEQSSQVNSIEWEANLEPVVLHERLAEAEREWEQKQEEELEPEPDDQIIVDYGKYAWVKLDREYCDAEGKAMGHCGNTGSPQEGDRILSFRSKVGETKQKPHLTFILDKDGYLGEMKGRGNDKPSEKYHPYIIDLLQKDFVKGIKGGGYLPENNFSLSDLDQEQVNALISEKPALMTPEEAYTYALEKVEGEWPEGEKAIAQKPDYAYEYAQDVIEGRFPEGEAAIAQDAQYAYFYARGVIEGRFPEGEAAIAQDVKFAGFYAQYVIKERWPEGEKAIAQDTYHAYYYARRVIEGRFPEPHRAKAEANIKKNADLWENYVEFLENNDE